MPVAQDGREDQGDQDGDQGDQDGDEYFEEEEQQQQQQQQEDERSADVNISTDIAGGKIETNAPYTHTYIYIYIHTYIHECNRRFP